MNFIKVEVVYNHEGGFASLHFTARDENEESRRDLDFISRAFLEDAPKRAGYVPGNTVRVDVKTELPPEDTSGNTDENPS